MKTKALQFSISISLLLLTFATLAQKPSINSFSPSSGPVGTLVTISGDNFGNSTAFSIGGVSAIVVSLTGHPLLGENLVGMVMPGATSGVISITTANGTTTSGSNFTITPTLYPSQQQGSKLVGAETVDVTQIGNSVSISADGNTAILGGQIANNGTYIYTRSDAGTWTQEGSELLGTGAAGNAGQGYSVSLSADGNTAIVGGPNDNGGTGAAWVYTRSFGVWTQQGGKLVGTGAADPANQGWSVSLSADGNTAIVGGPYDNNSAGAGWVYTRSGGVWTQQGSKLVGTLAAGQAYQGWSVSLSADGNTAILGGPGDNGITLETGAAWVFTRSGGVWTQQGSKLKDLGATSQTFQGWSVSLSSDGNTAIMGGQGDNNGAGAAWVYTRSGGAWTQQGSKLVSTEASAHAEQGISVSLSADGNTAIVGGFNDNNLTGAAWVYTRSGGVWTQQGSKLIGSGAVGNAQQGWSVSLSADGNTAIVGGNEDNHGQGASWVYISVCTTAPVKPGVIAGSLSACGGSTENIYNIGKVSGATSYNWVLSSGTITSGQGTSSIHVTFPASYSSISIKVQAINACGTSSFSSSITVKAPASTTPGTISGSTSVCGGSTGVVYSVAPVIGAASYKWVLSAGTITSGFVSNSILVTFPASYSSLTIEVQSVNSCGILSSAKSLTVTPPAVSKPGSISVGGGSAKVCPGDVRTYSVTAVAGMTYNWTAFTGAAIAGQGSHSITVTYGIGFTASSGVLSVTATGTCSTSSATTLTISRNTPSSPGTPNLTSGPVKVCPGDVCTYSVTAVPGMTYNWTSTSGAVITPGPSPFNTITINYSGSFTASSYKLLVTATNGCGTGSSSNLSISRNSPSEPGSISGTNAVCVGATDSYSISAVSNASSYNWTLPAGASISGAIHGTIISVVWGSTAGSVKVASVNGCGVSSQRSLSVSISCREDEADMIPTTDAILFPNPADKNINVNVSGFKGTTTMSIINLLGQEVYQSTLNINDNNTLLNVNVADLPAGIYLVSLRDGSNTAVRKFVKE